MEQQTIRIGHNRFPLPFPTREQSWHVRVGEGTSTGLPDVSDLPADEWAARADPAEIVVFLVMAVVLLIRPSGLFGESGLAE